MPYRTFSSLFSIISLLDSVTNPLCRIYQVIFITHTIKQYPFTHSIHTINVGRPRSRNVGLVSTTLRSPVSCHHYLSLSLLHYANVGPFSLMVIQTLTGHPLAQVGLGLIFLLSYIHTFHPLSIKSSVKV